MMPKIKKYVLILSFCALPSIVGMDENETKMDEYEMKEDPLNVTKESSTFSKFVKKLSNPFRKKKENVSFSSSEDQESKGMPTPLKVTLGLGGSALLIGAIVKIVLVVKGKKKVDDSSDEAKQEKKPSKKN